MTIKHGQSLTGIFNPNKVTLIHRNLEIPNPRCPQLAFGSTACDYFLLCPSSSFEGPTSTHKARILKSEANCRLTSTHSGNRRLDEDFMVQSFQTSSCTSRIRCRKGTS